MGGVAGGGDGTEKAPETRTELCLNVWLNTGLERGKSNQGRQTSARKGRIICKSGTHEFSGLTEGQKFLKHPPEWSDPIKHRGHPVVTKASP